MIKPAGATTIEDYLDQIDEPRKSEIQALHGLIRKAIPKLEPSIQSGMIGYGTYHYKYASGREGDSPVVALASQKSYISVYVCAANPDGYVAEKNRAELAPASVGKSCIRFKKLADIDQKTLIKVIKEGARVMAARNE
jgi:hypothetical protein